MGKGKLYAGIIIGVIGALALILGIVIGTNAGSQDFAAQNVANIMTIGGVVGVLVAVVLVILHMRGQSKNN